MGGSHINGHTLGMYAQNQMLKPCVQHKKKTVPQVSTARWLLVSNRFNGLLSVVVI